MPDSHQDDLIAKKFSRRKLLRWGLGLSAFGVAGESFWEPNRIELIQIRFPIANLQPDLEGFQIAVLSDLHWGHNIDLAFMERASKMVLASKPDIVVVPGDLYHGQGSHPSTAPSLEGVFDFFRDVPLYGVLGNHDHSLGKKFVREQVAKHSHMELLDNRRTLIQKGQSSLVLAGVGDLWGDKVSFDKVMVDLDEQMPRILLSHNPDVAEFMPNDNGARVDLQISGHTHGGQMVLPGLYNPYSRLSEYGDKFNRGLVQGKRHPVFVSKGLAKLNHMRFCALPDVACIRLTRAS